jgi:hypothetical protein
MKAKHRMSRRVALGGFAALGALTALSRAKWRMLHGSDDFASLDDPVATAD